MRFPHWMKISAFGNHVIAVGLRVSEEQVIRAKASWGVAMVENLAHFFRYQFLGVDYPRGSVRGDQSGSAINSLGGNGSIPFSIYPSGPYPARAKFWPMRWRWAIFVNIRPKSNVKRFVKSKRLEPIGSCPARCRKSFRVAFAAWWNLVAKAVRWQNTLGFTNTANQPISPSFDYMVEAYDFRNWPERWPDKS
jgi:hypothetical protein